MKCNLRNLIRSINIDMAASLLTTAHLLVLAVAVSTAPVLTLSASAQTHNEEALVKISQAITVRLAGATEGSGALVKREDNIYTVITAWHVVSGQRSGEELDIFTFDGERHTAIEESIKRVENSDTAYVSFRSSEDYILSSPAKRVGKADMVYVSGFTIGAASKPARLVRARMVGSSDCVSQSNRGGLLYKIQIPENHSQKTKTRNAEDSGSRLATLSRHYEDSHKFVVHPDWDTSSGMSGGPILLSNGTIIGHHNGGLGGTGDWGVVTKHGLNRGSLLPIDSPIIDGYLDKLVVCNVFNAYDNWQKRMHSEAADFSLSSYRMDKNSLPFVAMPLQASLMSLGRFDILCQIHTQDSRLNNASLDYVCRKGIPGMYQP